ncbi:transposon-like protein [Tanacetum coccineum]|uniref:Transposon-like protein n=1 Tax=Tanacetum coccineum TaxID=301880 RepID=A0ABQ5G1W2_9ASTR
MERDIVVTMCKLEKILPPGFFDHMEHLLVHLSYKAKVGGPVQYRWMYPFERYLYHLKKKVKNKIEKVGRNDDRGSVNLKGTSLSVFNYRGRPSGTCKRCYLDDDEYDVATFYVLHNCEEIQPFLAEMKVERPNITTVELIDMTQQRRKTLNTDICLVGEEGDYYGQLTDVIKLEYTSCSKVVLFRCDWFDPVKNQGWKIHNEFGLVDINHKKKLMKYDPFIMAHQALQVYFIRYPSIRKNKVDWLAVCRIPARSTIVAPTQPIEYAYKEDGTSLPFIVTENDEIEQLHDVEGDVEEVELQHLGFVCFSEVLPLHLQTMSAEEEIVS